MLSIDLLLRQMPNLRVIHLMRDPRAVVLSRERFAHYFLGLNSMAEVGDNRMYREMSLYCRYVAAEMVVRKRLEVKYPGRWKTF